MRHELILKIVSQLLLNYSREDLVQYFLDREYDILARLSDSELQEYYDKLNRKEA